MPASVEILSPATVANVGPGFDILGFALDTPGDIIEIKPIKGTVHRIENISGIDLPRDPGKNVSTVAIDALLAAAGSKQKFEVCFKKKIPAGSGIGSSAASSAGAVYGVNLLLGKPFGDKELVPFAMKGEEVASGSAHADNVAPALLGGFVLIRSYNPLDIISLEGPARLVCSIVHPEISIATEDSRRILKTQVPLKTALTQCGNVAGLVTGLLKSDYRLIRDSMHDVIAEPVRSFLIPEFDAVKRAALDAGALGCSISGSGPSIFALSQDHDTAERVAGSMEDIFSKAGISRSVFVSQVNTEGIKLLSEE